MPTLIGVNSLLKSQIILAKRSHVSIKKFLEFPVDTINVWLITTETNSVGTHFEYPLASLEVMHPGEGLTFICFKAVTIKGEYYFPFLSSETVQ